MYQNLVAHRMVRNTCFSWIGDFSVNVLSNLEVFGGDMIKIWKPFQKNSSSYHYLLIPCSYQCLLAILRKNQTFLLVIWKITLDFNHELFPFSPDSRNTHDPIQLPKQHHCLCQMWSTWGCEMKLKSWFDPIRPFNLMIHHLGSNDWIRTALIMPL